MPTSFRIAIADDDADTRLLLKRYLVSAGHEVVTEAASGEELIEACKVSLPDLIITDMLMDGIDGVSAALQVNESHKIPTIVVSGYLNDTLLANANSSGVFGYLIKPVGQDELTATVAIVMQRFQEFQILRQDAESLRGALEERKIVEQAKGIVMRNCKLEEATAFRHLQQLARSNRQKLIDVARSILLAEQAFTRPRGSGKA
jgi:response regulator NasT